MSPVPTSLKTFILDKSRANIPLWVAWGEKHIDDATVVRGYLKLIRAYLKGFERGGHRYPDDETIYPLLFLIRHALEMALKDFREVVVAHHVLFPFPNVHPDFKQKKMDDRKWDTHSLHGLFSQIKELVSQETIFKNPEFLAMENLFQEFDQEIDPEATAFRYIRNRQQQVQDFHSQQRWVDMFGLCSATETVAERLFLFACDKRFEYQKEGLLLPVSVADFKSSATALKVIVMWLEADPYYQKTMADSESGGVRTIGDMAGKAMKELPQFGEFQDRFSKFLSGLTGGEPESAFWAFLSGRNPRGIVTKRAAEEG